MAETGPIPVDLSRPPRRPFGHRFEIRHSPDDPRLAVVLLDGRPLDRVTAYALEAHSGSAIRELTLTFLSDGVQVTTGPAPVPLSDSEE